MCLPSTSKAINSNFLLKERIQQPTRRWMRQQQKLKNKIITRQRLELDSGDTNLLSALCTILPNQTNFPSTLMSTALIKNFNEFPFSSVYFLEGVPMYDNQEQMLDLRINSDPAEAIDFFRFRPRFFHLKMSVPEADEETPPPTQNNSPEETSPPVHNGPPEESSPPTQNNPPEPTSPSIQYNPPERRVSIPARMRYGFPVIAAVYSLRDRQAENALRVAFWELSPSDEESEERAFDEQPALPTAEPARAVLQQSAGLQTQRQPDSHGQRHSPELPEHGANDEDRSSRHGSTNAARPQTRANSRSRSPLKSSSAAESKRGSHWRDRDGRC